MTALPTPTYLGNQLLLSVNQINGREVKIEAALSSRDLKES
jgi:hypothetical protein